MYSAVPHIVCVRFFMCWPFMNGNVFAYPKPVSLMYPLVSSSTFSALRLRNAMPALCRSLSTRTTLAT